MRARAQPVSSSAHAQQCSRRCAIRASSSSTKNTIRRSNSRKAFAIRRAIWPSCGRSERASRSCSDRRRPRWKAWRARSDNPRRLLSLPHRAADALPPRLSLIDLRQHGDAQGIATPALLAMRRHLDAGNQVLLFLNRRGYAPVLFCPACGWSAHCKRCDAHLTVHRGSDDLLCHHCGAQPRARAMSTLLRTGEACRSRHRAHRGNDCAACSRTKQLARIDRDSMRRKGELEATLARVDRNEIRILVGTQMLTKGHHFPNVTLVVVLNADQGLFSTDFRASERLAQTHRAGRRSRRSGRTAGRSADSDRISGTSTADPAADWRVRGLRARRARRSATSSGWPPFTRIALLRAEATAPKAALQFLRSSVAGSSIACSARRAVLRPGARTDGTTRRSLSCAAAAARSDAWTAATTDEHLDSGARSAAGCAQSALVDRCGSGGGVTCRWQRVNGPRATARTEVDCSRSGRSLIARRL